MLIFGVGIYAMFVGSKEMNRNKGSLIPESNFFGFFPLKVSNNFCVSLDMILVFATDIYINLILGLYLAS